MTDLKFELLSDYDLGRLVALIEWVARGGKPIASCAARQTTDAEREALKRDIVSAIQLSGEESVKGYLLNLPSGMVEYGVYENEWALRARVHLLKDECPEWLQGIVFGYTARSVAQFNDVFGGLESTLPLPDDESRVESVRPCLEQFHTHSIQNDRCQRFQHFDL